VSRRRTEFIKVGTLFLVATPIGHLEDVTLRALRVLREAELVLAEDTRRTRILLDRHGISARPLSLHAHNESARIDRVLGVLAAGGSAALVSDAGTPLVSDPGERLTAAAIEAGHAVVAVPGASAVLAALSVAGLPTARFTFAGFLPRRTRERDAWLEAWRDREETLVLFESPRRLGATLSRLLEILGDRRACVARELTKLHEEAARGTLRELAARFSTGARGEVTIVVGGRARETAPAPAPDLDAAIRDALAAGESTRAIAARLSVQCGVSRREVYGRALAVREGRDAGRGPGAPDSGRGVR
jgi:16S rRNA (cytidine1402-2'-O)-methyltransferase